ncbi:DnaA regulatory inactivator Hda [Lampropedia puyangensis]|uniref:DnaA regulatory inactivator Hda n=1 Tax=Lampropedia puyangensis TaxID=1330072 RepID=A0A4S8FE87_9BURK|nr:DnaA regulatory inactivator Hda [Lampropedia puyangensis]THU05391.1 DnaA regulatory inactivator Hda [Lampropedia puyangensis]
MQQLVLDIGMAPEPSFERYLPCGNEGALQALQEGMASAINLHAQSEQAAYTAPIPVYLWGGPGTGKTHLLTSVALALQSHGLSVGWLQPGIYAGKPNAREFNPQWSAVLIDDADQLSKAEQQRAFNWFINATYPSDGPPCWVIATGSAPAIDLAMRDDLRSRLGSGLSFELHPLSDVQRQAVLQLQARERGLHLSDEVAQYLLGRFARDLSSLSELLARLDVHALRTQRAITIPLLREVLHDSPASLP